MSIATAEEIATLEEARLILRRAYKSGKLGDWRGLVASNVASNASESLRLLVEILENERRLEDFLGVEDGPLPGEVTHGDERFLMVKGSDQDEAAVTVWLTYPTNARLVWGEVEVAEQKTRVRAAAELQDGGSWSGEWVEVPRNAGWRLYLQERGGGDPRAQKPRGVIT